MESKWDNYVGYQQEINAIHSQQRPGTLFNNSILGIGPPREPWITKACRSLLAGFVY